ncbi:hypothetical protein ACR6C2_07625 [Streptomyces sp. INA 01156]
MADTTAAPSPASTRNPKQRQASSIRAEARFRARVVELGGQVTGSYVSNRTPVDVVCVVGHRTTVRPADLVNKGTGLCRTCAGKDREQLRPRSVPAWLSWAVPSPAPTGTGSHLSR